MDESRRRERFEGLVRPHFASLFRTARRIVGNPALAEELVQDACLRAFEAFDLDGDRRVFRPWLFRVLVNVCIDFLRKAEREAGPRAGASPELIASVPDPSVRADPHRLLASREMAASIDRALAGLAVELRVVVILVLIEELSYAEAARSLDVSEQMVKSRLYRARTYLRQALRGDFGDRSDPGAATASLSLPPAYT